MQSIRYNPFRNTTKRLKKQLKHYRPLASSRMLGKSNSYVPSISLNRNYGFRMKNPMNSSNSNTNKKTVSNRKWFKKTAKVPKPLYNRMPTPYYANKSVSIRSDSNSSYPKRNTVRKIQHAYESIHSSEF